MLINAVAPFAGAWIEIRRTGYDYAYLVYVAPFAGAWIEMNAENTAVMRYYVSLPSRERGLKFGARIRGAVRVYCRSLRGSVD